MMIFAMRRAQPDGSAATSFRKGLSSPLLSPDARNGYGEPRILIASSEVPRLPL